MATEFSSILDGLNEFVNGMASTLEDDGRAGAKTGSDSEADSAAGSEADSDTPSEEDGEAAFAASHSPLTCAIHQQLEAVRYQRSVWLPPNSNDGCIDYPTSSACKEAAERIIKAAYTKAHQYFDIQNEQSVVRQALAFYCGIVEDCFDLIMPQLERTSRSLGRTAYYDNLSRLVGGFREFLTGKFRAEIAENADYYHLYKLEYFTGLAEVEEHDYRIGEGIFKVIETLFGDSLTYTYTGVFEAISEMNDDLNRLTDTFFSCAWREYCRQQKKIEAMVEGIGKGLPEFLDGEDLIGYLVRVGSLQPAAPNQAAV